MHNPVVLGLGSNKSTMRNASMLTPCMLLYEACVALSDFLSQIRFSSIYRTKPMYVENQEDFLNMAVYGFFEGTPEILLQKTQAVENKFGRNRDCEIKNGPRSLDIDIELFGNRHVTAPDLHIPHQKLTERAFVLIPMLEILDESTEIKDRAFYMNCLRNLDTKDTVQFYKSFSL
ncbi:MAG: 2-amino-4-hydroxy-6-hydroxymethyldihydropteridine diphosphokinase [Spirochaetales bacterium]